MLEIVGRWNFEYINDFKAQKLIEFQFFGSLSSLSHFVSLFLFFSIDLGGALYLLMSLSVSACICVCLKEIFNLTPELNQFN